MTSHGVVALACVRCENGYSVPILSHLRAEHMSKQLKAFSEAVKTNSVLQEQLKAFGEAIKTNLPLQEQLKKADEPEAVVQIAKAAGYEISTKDLVSVIEISEKRDEEMDIELSDEELEQVAGGGFFAIGVIILMLSGVIAGYALSRK